MISVSVVACPCPFRNRTKSFKDETCMMQCVFEGTIQPFTVMGSDVLNVGYHYTHLAERWRSAPVRPAYTSYLDTYA